jgi:hypothetical protein
MVSEDSMSSPSESDLDREIATAAQAKITVRALRERVSVVETGIVHFLEMTAGTPETLRIMGTRIEELARPFDAYGIIIDLTQVDGGTTSEYRRFIPEHFNGHAERSAGRLKLVAVVFDANPVLRVAVRFLIARASKVRFSVYRTLPLACDGVREAIR